jgi:hypothetical protein
MNPHMCNSAGHHCTACLVTVRTALALVPCHSCMVPPPKPPLRSPHTTPHVTSTRWPQTPPSGDSIHLQHPLPPNVSAVKAPPKHID